MAATTQVRLLVRTFCDQHDATNASLTRRCEAICPRSCVAAIYQIAIVARISSRRAA